MLRGTWVCLAAAFGCGAAAAAAEAGAPLSAAAILQEMREFRDTGSILYVAAHPDDENSRLLAYLAQGRACRTGYLSLTRGDGGQNLIGPELGDELGVIRTQELLGARRVDGARQFFSRARDFGFSKDYRQTLSVWDEKEVLSDVVRTIRTFRPDVIITRFPPWPSHTHGQHTASAVLALHAYRLAGDPKAFSEQGLPPWRPRRILWNSTPFGRRGAPPGPLPARTFRLDAGGFQPILGEWFGVLAARSRSMQRTQGMGSVGVRGSWFEWFQLLDGEPAKNDFFDGIDTTWGRYPGGGSLVTPADRLIGDFNPQRPVASVPAILALRKQLAALPADPVVDEKRRLLDRILQGCLGLYVETVVPAAEVVPGETLHLRHTAIAGGEFPVRWLGVRYPAAGRTWGAPVDLATDRPAVRSGAEVLPAATPVSQATWLREKGTKGMFGVPASAEGIRPENPPVFPVAFLFEVGGQTLVIPDEPVQVVGEPARGEIRRRLEVIPPVSLDFDRTVELFPPGGTRGVDVAVTAARPNVVGTLQLELPGGWKAEPARQDFRLGLSGERAIFHFEVTAPSRTEAADISARAEVGAARFNTRRVEVRYEHIPEFLYQPPASLRAVDLELAIRGHRVGYLPGAGDGVEQSLKEMGYAVTRLNLDDLTPEGLRGFDAVVFGVRCFNVLAGLSARLPAVWDYVRAGGNCIVQYNTDYGLKSGPLAPFDLTLSADRVTDENAPVTLLAPDHPALTTPNRIGPEDFAGWVQERARYLPSSWAPEFTPLLESHDPGEGPNRASLLVARYGRGYVVYSGLSWFHELPAGVPGAFRLFANLISLGK